MTVMRTLTVKHGATTFHYRNNYLDVDAALAGLPLHATAVAQLKRGKTVRRIVEISGVTLAVEIRPTTLNEAPRARAAGQAVGA